MKRLVSLSMVWFNTKFMGCRYSRQTEELVSFYPIPDHDEIDRWLKVHQEIVEEKHEEVKTPVKRTATELEPPSVETTPAKLPKLDPLPPQNEPASEKSLDYNDLTQHLDALISTLRRRSDGSSGGGKAAGNRNNNGNKDRGEPVARSAIVGRLSGHCICDTCYPNLSPVCQLQVLCSRQKMSEKYEFSEDCQQILLYINEYCMIQQPCSAKKGAKTSIAQEMVNEVLAYQRSHTMPTCPAARNRTLSLDEVKQGGSATSDKKLTEDNKGHQMLLKMGWSGEGGLGSAGREDPIEMSVRGRNRSGFGSTQELALHSKDVRSVLMTFIESEDTQLEFPSSLTAEERKMIHTLCEQYHLYHKSRNSGDERFLMVRKKISSSPGAGLEKVAMETQQERQGPSIMTHNHKNKYYQPYKKF